jgi:GGDEF domain-containing protein
LGCPIANIVCRLGGDEFLIMLMSDQGANFKSEIANKVLASISLPISLDTDELVSVGASLALQISA